jgi:imidazole glycerol-phosphate synthase subunit HisF
LKYNRIIPRLDIKGPNLVKGIHLEGLRVLGKPEDFAKLYYEQGADELIYQDTVASLYQRNSLEDIITKTAKNIFIPITVGGGLRNLDDINRVLRAGADKVSINTAAVKEPDFINKASRIFGSSTIVISIESVKQPDGTYLAYTDNGREFTGVDVVQWAKEVEKRGAGEILLTSIDQEGTGNGFDEALIEKVSDCVDIPIIAHGGGGNVGHIYNAISRSGADAISVASMIHYTAINKKKIKINFSNNDEGNRSFLTKKKSFKMFGEDSIENIKSQLNKKGISLRFVD